MVNKICTHQLIGKVDVWACWFRMFKKKKLVKTKHVRHMCDCKCTPDLESGHCEAKFIEDKQELIDLFGQEWRKMHQ